jgi:acyl-coenzyme A synthetase/AMP-(fatty) acid ligase
MSNYKEFYIKILRNMNSNNIFYKYYDESYTYKDFKNFSLKLLSFFENNNLKKKKITIITYSNKSFEMYASIFPILLSNFVWVPISTKYPTERIISICNQIKPDIFLHDIPVKKKIEKYVFKKFNCKLLDYRTIFNYTISKKNLISNLIKNIDYNNTAFIYFTSGSTGIPKGIKISHYNIIHQVFYQQNHLYKNSTKNLVFGDYYDTAFSIFFDIYFPAIYFKSCISPSRKKYENFLIKEHFLKNNVNNLICVPSTIERLKNYYGTNFKLNCKTVIFTGEPFYLKLLDYALKIFKTKKIFNCYGGTEMGNWSFFHKCNKKDLLIFKKDNLVPIGRPFSDIKIKISKRGELITKGKCISLGYLDNKFNDKFIFKKGGNTFFTSDLVIRKNNKIICKGRIDNMVKIGGHRIEIPDIEANFYKLKYIKQCAVFSSDSKNYNNYLFACISVYKKTKITDSQIRKDLGSFLPTYMVPKVIKIFSELPLNSNGKIDRKKLKKREINLN